jgi:hypothetical protein
MVLLAVKMSPSGVQLFSCPRLGRRRSCCCLIPGWLMLILRNFPLFHNFFADNWIQQYAWINTSVLSLVHQACGASHDSSYLKCNGLQLLCHFMGMRPSPYNAVWFYYWGEEFAKENLCNPSNPFDIDKICLPTGHGGVQHSST